MMSNYQALHQLRMQITDVKHVMKNNMDVVIERGHKLDDLIGRSDRLQANCEQFRKSSVQVRRKAYLRSFKMTLLVVIAFMLFGSFVFVCARTNVFSAVAGKLAQTSTPTQSTVPDGATFL